MGHPILRLLSSLPPTLIIPAALLLFSISSTIIASFLYVTFSIYSYQLRSSNSRRRRIILAKLEIFETESNQRQIVGFFHPYCNAGGGGERVLWTAVAWLQRQEKNAICAVYTGDHTAERKPVEKTEMVEKVKLRFGIELDEKTLVLIPLKTRFLVEDGYWRHFTLLGQSLGSMWLALEGLRTGLIPDIWIDTMGYAFTYPLISGLAGVPVGSYTHYPTISTDMLDRVASQQEGHTNQSIVAKSIILTSFKLIYYQIFAELYSLSLRKADVLMVNSSWTKAHVDRLLRPFGYRDDAAEEDLPVESEAPASTTLWQRKTGAKVIAQETAPKIVKRFKIATIVYPPCDTLAFSDLPLESRQNMILSVAQFRPEKEHARQLQALRLLFNAHLELENGEKKWKLIMAGSVRNEGDEARVETLRALCAELKLTNNVEIAINVPYPRLIELFGEASIGLHTMIDEHFGITVVEIMAAGLIPIVHASAGPLLDIVTPYPIENPLPTGFHSTSANSFAENLSLVMEMTELEILAMRKRARLNAQERFSTENFEKGWKLNWDLLKLKLN